MPKHKVNLIFDTEALKKTVRDLAIALDKFNATHTPRIIKEIEDLNEATQKTFPTDQDKNQTPQP